MKGDRLLGLDALRGVAAVIVLIYHCIWLFEPNFLSEWKIARMGYLAVDFFFVLSGYVIARMLSRRPKTPLQFLWARYRRFWSVMAVGTLIGILAYFLEKGGLPDLLTIGASFALIPLLTNTVIFALNPPAWSIFFELFANLVHAFLPKNFWPLVWIVALAAMAFNKDMGTGTETIHFWGGFDRVLVAYALGVMLFEWWKDEPPIKLNCGWTALLLLLIAPISSQWFYYGFVFVACPVMLAAALRWEPRWAPVLGDLSFPLYAVHGPVLTLLRAAGPIWAGLVAIIIASLLVRLGISGPVRSRRTPVPAPADAAT